METSLQSIFRHVAQEAGCCRSVSVIAWASPQTAPGLHEWM